MSNPVSRKVSNEDQQLIQEYLDKGGVVTQKAYGERSEEIGYTGGFYQRRKKKSDAEKNKDEE